MFLHHTDSFHIAYLNTTVHFNGSNGTAYTRPSTVRNNTKSLEKSFLGISFLSFFRCSFLKYSFISEISITLLARENNIRKKVKKKKTYLLLCAFRIIHMEKCKMICNLKIPAPMYKHCNSKSNGKDFRMDNVN
jgi:hypothetical protein